MVKHVDRNRGITRKEAINVKYGRNENNDLHYGRGVNDNMNYVDEDDNMNHKDMGEDIQSNRDTNKGNSREQNSDVWRFLLRRNKQEVRNTKTMKIIEQKTLKLVRRTWVILKS